MGIQGITDTDHGNACVSCLRRSGFAQAGETPLRMESEVLDRLSLFLRLSNIADDKGLFAEVIQP